MLYSYTFGPSTLADEAVDKGDNLTFAELEKVLGRGVAWVKGGSEFDTMRKNEAAFWAELEAAQPGATVMLVEDADAVMNEAQKALAKLLNVPLKMITSVTVHFDA
jgi:hypothetical protein